jgi:hypothetical protein
MATAVTLARGAMAAMAEQVAMATTAHPALEKTAARVDRAAWRGTVDPEVAEVQPVERELRQAWMAMEATEVLAGWGAPEDQAEQVSRESMARMPRISPRLKMAVSVDRAAMARRAALAEPEAWVETHRELLWREPTGVVEMVGPEDRREPLETAATVAREAMRFRMADRVATAAIPGSWEQVELAVWQGAREPSQAQTEPMEPPRPAAGTEAMAARVLARPRPARTEAMVEPEAMAERWATAARVELAVMEPQERTASQDCCPGIPVATAKLEARAEWAARAAMADRFRATAEPGAWPDWAELAEWVETEPRERMEFCPGNPEAREDLEGPAGRAEPEVWAARAVWPSTARPAQPESMAQAAMAGSVASAGSVAMARMERLVLQAPIHRHPEPPGRLEAMAERAGMVERAAQAVPAAESQPTEPTATAVMRERADMVDRAGRVVTVTAVLPAQAKTAARVERVARLGMVATAGSVVLEPA